MISQSSVKAMLKNLSQAVLVCSVSLLLVSVLILLFSENPIKVFEVLGRSFAQSKYDMGLTLFYSTAFIFSGLAFSLPFKAGLFHIGVEGQIIATAATAAMLGIVLPESLGTFGLMIVFLGSVFCSLCVSALISFYKLKKQSHEVVVAIMLNFILIALSHYFILHFFQNPDSQNPESSLINPGFQFFKTDVFKNYFDQSAISLFFVLALLSCVFVWIFETKTKWGLLIKAYGINPKACARMQISPVKIHMFSLGLAGFFAACVGMTEILGNSFQFKLGFSPAYGFLGIVVALLAQGNPLGIIISGFLLAVLHKGASDLDLETQFLTRDFSKVLQAVIIFSVTLWVYLQSRKKRSL